MVRLKRMLAFAWVLVLAGVDQELMRGAQAADLPPRCASWNRPENPGLIAAFFRDNPGPRKPGYDGLRNWLKVRADAGDGAAAYFLGGSFEAMPAAGPSITRPSPIGFVVPPTWAILTPRLSWA